MPEITTMLTGATTLFGLVATLTITVTGFFLGKKWVKRIG